MKHLTGIDHVADFPYAFIKTKNSVELRLKTPKDQVKEVIVGYNDPYNYTVEENTWIWEELTKPMNKQFTTKLYDWWIITLNVPTKRFAYHFKINDGEKTYFLTESGLSDDWKTLEQFNLPYSYESEIFTYPKWIDDAIWYQIFPDRFAKYEDNLEDVKVWKDQTVTNEMHFGGNIKGVINKLDYLKDLGVNAIYFTPIFKAKSSHKYDTLDYFELDPGFGDEQDFKDLIKKAHELNIKVMLDGVFNHVSNNHEFFLDVIKNKERSKYKDWFYINDFNKLDNKEEHDLEFRKNYPYETFGYSSSMPKLKVTNKEVRNYLLEVTKKWTKLGIDGWRLDVANEVNHKFWKDFKKVAQEINPEIYIVGEIWHDSQMWLRGDEFHAVMNYKYTSALISYFGKKEIDKETFEDRIICSLMQYQTNIHKGAFNVIDTHDTIRIFNLCNKDFNRQKLLLIYLFTQQGSPCIYYGSEIGLSGEQDPNNRGLMLWDKKDWNMEFYDFYKKIIEIRKNNPLLRNGGKFRVVKTDNDLLVYEKYNQNQVIRICINNSDLEYVYDIKDCKNIIYKQGYIDNKVHPNGFIIFEK